MKIKQLIFIIFMLIVSISCHKKSSDDTIKYSPPSYLPLYPKSYWKYKIGNDTILTKTSDSIFEILSTTAIIWDKKIINGYRKLYGDGFYGTSWVKILSETVGESFSESKGDPRLYPGYYITRVLQKTKDSFGDSIIIQKRITYAAGPNTYPTKYWVYQTYKKNVGLFLEYEVDSLTKDTIYKKTLINYFINKNLQY